MKLTSFHKKRVDVIKQVQLFVNLDQIVCQKHLLLMTTDSGVMNVFKMRNSSEITTRKSTISQEHEGQIYSIDICFEKKLILTCGRDMKIKFWNFKKSVIY
jgi:hypothetical protein